MFADEIEKKFGINDNTQFYHQGRPNLSSGPRFGHSWVRASASQSVDLGFIFFDK